MTPTTPAASAEHAYDANAHLELLPSGPGWFCVWLFDLQIGEGATEAEALDDARSNISRWTESQ